MHVAWSLAGALDAINLDITEFRLDNHYTAESQYSQVAWAAVLPPLFGDCCAAHLQVVSWLLDRGGGDVGCVGCAGELVGHTTTLQQQSSPPHLVGLATSQMGNSCMNA